MTPTALRVPTAAEMYVIRMESGFLHTETPRQFCPSTLPRGTDDVPPTFQCSAVPARKTYGCYSIKLQPGELVAAVFVSSGSLRCCGRTSSCTRS